MFVTRAGRALRPTLCATRCGGDGGRAPARQVRGARQDLKAGAPSAYAFELDVTLRASISGRSRRLRVLPWTFSSTMRESLRPVPLWRRRPTSPIASFGRLHGVWLMAVGAARRVRGPTEAGPRMAARMAGLLKS